jgi:hypothetical protein
MKRSLIGLTALILILALIGGVWVNRIAVYDYFRLLNYTPPAAVASLATQDELTPKALHLLYVYHPKLETSAQFNNDCKVTEQAIVLGCTVIGKGIYLYNVTDPRLNGVEQVTVAHEMLHVAYSRLSTSERNYINNLVISTYNSLAPTHPQLKSEYDNYMRTVGQSEIDNELHSVLGTEIPNLPPALENYYKQYFKDRQVITNYAASYQNSFTSLQSQVKADDQQLSTWLTTINSNEDQINKLKNQITSENAQLTSLKESGQINAYNSGVDQYNIDADNYNSLVSTTKNLIEQYNQLVEQRNNSAFAENNLTKSLSSLPTNTIPTN